MTRTTPTNEEIRRDEALLRTLLIHGVPVKTLAKAIGVSRQTVYRRMQRARTNLRRAAQVAPATADDNGL